MVDKKKKHKCVYKGTDVQYSLERIQINSY